MLFYLEMGESDPKASSPRRVSVSRTILGLPISAIGAVFQGRAVADDAANCVNHLHRQVAK